MGYKNKQKQREYNKQYELSHKDELSKKRQLRKRQQSEYAKKYNSDPTHRAAKKEWSETYYLLNKNKILKRIKKWSNGIRMQILLHYSDGRIECACCGETMVKFLTIDHLEGGGVKHKKERRGIRLDLWLYKNNFPRGYRILCYNCNCGRALNNGICPHKDFREREEKDYADIGRGR
jgi:hypothetical protein